eukprot:3565194-Pleurochrysis_carterae.AAC.4
MSIAASCAKPPSSAACIAVSTVAAALRALSTGTSACAGTHAAKSLLACCHSRGVQTMESWSASRERRSAGSRAAPAALMAVAAAPLKEPAVRSA